MGKRVSKFHFATVFSATRYLVVFDYPLQNVAHHYFVVLVSDPLFYTECELSTRPDIKLLSFGVVGKSKVVGEAKLECGCTTRVTTWYGNDPRTWSFSS